MPTRPWTTHRGRPAATGGCGAAAAGTAFRFGPARQCGNWNTARSRCVNLGFRVAREIPAQPRPAGQVTLVFGGNVMLDGGPGHELVYGTDPFADFAKLLHKADISVCNLECVFRTGGQQVLKPYTFRGPVQAVPVLEKSFTAVSVANNHTGDFGPDAFSRQLTMFSDAGLFWFGGGRTRRKHGGR